MPLWGLRGVCLMHESLSDPTSHQSGDIEIVNHKTNDRCQLKFMPYSYFSKEAARKVSRPAPQPLGTPGSNPKGAHVLLRSLLPLTCR